MCHWLAASPPELGCGGQVRPVFPLPPHPPLGECVCVRARPLGCHGDGTLLAGAPHPSPPALTAGPSFLTLQVFLVTHLGPGPSVPCVA